MPVAVTNEKIPVASIHSIIKAIELQRPGYAASVSYTADVSYSPVELPDNLMAVFSFVKGTPHEIANQTMMDFLPGHRLMCATEIPIVRERLQEFYGVDELFDVRSRTPFLTNYSSDYYLTDDDDNGVFWLDHQGGVSLVSPNLDTFLFTTLRCFEQSAYRMGSDGLLDVDDELEQQIGVKLNPGCDFWLD